MVWSTAPSLRLRYAGEHHGRCAGAGAAPAKPAPSGARKAWWWLVAACGLVLAHLRRDARRLVGAVAARRAPRPIACSATSRRSSWTSATPTWRSTAARPPSRSAASTTSPTARPRRSSARSPGGTLSIVSRCPDQVLGSCRASYRLTVPDNVPLEIETTGGSVQRVARARLGPDQQRQGHDRAPPASAASCCARARTPATCSAASECSADRLELRSRTGDVHATVPAGRYQIDAQSDSGTTRIRGLSDSDDAPFQIQALSTSGDVTVEAAS